jgi:hypothetical protein
MPGRVCVVYGIIVGVGVTVEALRISWLRYYRIWRDELTKHWVIVSCAIVVEPSFLV